MKNKAIISLMMVATLLLSVTLALAENFVADPLTSVSSGGWTTTAGLFIPTGTGVKSSNINPESKAIHPVTTAASGAFTFESKFKVNDNKTDVHPGVGTDTDSVCVGWNNASQQFFVVKNNVQPLAYLGGTLDKTATYTAKITSTDGANFVCGVYKDGAQVGSTYTYTSGFKPTNVIVWIENYGSSNGPEVMSVNFQSSASASPTPSPSPSPSAQPNSTTKFALDLQDIRNYYANLPVVHMSNQSVIYNPDGTIKQVITGNQITTTPAATPTATVKPNATATPVPAQTNVTAVPSVPAPTKTQAPGFELVLAAIGMISALVLITRKKK